MKKFLIGILTLLMFIILVVLGVSRNVKGLIVDTLDITIKKEITNEIVDYITDNTDKPIEEVKTSIDEFLNENKAIKKTVNTYMDKFMDILNDKEVSNIDLSKEIESIINDSEPILKEYGINLSNEEKQELLEVVSSAEVNKAFNESVKEFKEEMPSDVKKALDIFKFITSTNFKLMLIGGVGLLLILIALLKKSYYKWLNNLGWSALLSGLFIGVSVPFFIDNILKEQDIIVSFETFSNYGYTSIILGIILLIINIIISKIISKNKKAESN